MGDLNVYVGAEVEQMLATKVLEYSIRKHASITVNVLPLFEAIANARIQFDSIQPKGASNRTPFSFQRFAIPQLEGFKGRAVYVDSDMLVFKDIAELSRWPFGDNHLLSCKVAPGVNRRPQFSVIVLDCEHLKWNVQEIVKELELGRWTYHELMYELTLCEKKARDLPSYWNCLEYYSPGESALVHFTDMLEQPWLSTVSTLTELWTKALIEAIADGFLSKTFVEEEIHKGWVRPSLAYQIECGDPDPRRIPAGIVALDRSSFVSPPEHAAFLKSLTGYGKSNPSEPELLARKVYASTRFRIRSGGKFAARVMARTGLSRTR